jgi:hypothetical protein
MRLSEERIEAISLAITDRIAENELVDLTMDEEDLAHLVAAVLLKDLAREDEIQRAAVEWVNVNKKHMEPGDTDWQIEVDRQRHKMAIQRGYVLP